MYDLIKWYNQEEKAYLNALGQADINVGIIPSDGAHATIKQIPSFVNYMTELMISDITQDIAFLNADPTTTSSTESQGVESHCCSYH